MIPTFNRLAAVILFTKISASRTVTVDVRKIAIVDILSERRLVTRLRKASKFPVAFVWRYNTICYVSLYIRVVLRYNNGVQIFKLLKITFCVHTTINERVQINFFLTLLIFNRFYFQIYRYGRTKWVLTAFFFSLIESDRTLSFFWSWAKSFLLTTVCVMYIWSTTFHCNIL